MATATTLVLRNRAGCKDCCEHLELAKSYEQRFANVLARNPGDLSQGPGRSSHVASLVSAKGGIRSQIR